MDDDDDAENEFEDKEDDLNADGVGKFSPRMFRAAAAWEKSAEMARSREFVTWAQNFRAAAEADDYAIFRDHLRRLGLPDEPLLLLEGTIHFVVMWIAFFSLGRKESFARLLKMQTYDPAEAPDARYAFTFDLCGKAYARILIDTKSGNLDLADMNEAPWLEHRVAGYRSFDISHLDWSPLTDDERCQLETEVTDDLYDDYTEDELAVWVENLDYDSFDETYLRVHVQERDEEDEEEKEEEDQAPHDEP